uniref:Uncharacterized protein n=1 Tax=Aegilops tauschii subsp. strangulata TaxID=200361 RepID=A0A453DIG5_AEGTS
SQSCTGIDTGAALSSGIVEVTWQSELRVLLVFLANLLITVRHFGSVQQSGE